jgi:hypothetical protein
MTRRVASASVIVGVLLLVGSFAAVAAADDGGGVGFFDVTANATGIGASFGDPTTTPYPVAAGLVPNTVAQLTAGPSGQAQSSVFWPGPLAGNAGSLANVIGTPLPPDVVSNANYPVVARASSAAGGSDEDTLGPMHAKVAGSDSSASTTLSNVDAPGVVTAAKVVTTSHSFIDTGKPTAVGESVLEGVTVAGGVLSIGSIHTIAHGATDGTQATTSQKVTVAGVTVNGRPATVDRSGLHVSGSNVPAGSVLDGGKPALDPLGVTAYVTDARSQSSTDGAGAIASGSVFVVWSPPRSGPYLVIVLGGSSVAVRATPGSDFTAGGDAGPSAFFAPAEPTAVLPTPSFSPSAGSAGAALGALASTSSGAGGGRAGSGVAAAAPIQSGAPLDLAVAVTDRPPFGWVLMGIVGALLVSLGVHSFRQQALAAAVAGTHCPLEKGS